MSTSIEIPHLEGGSITLPPTIAERQELLEARLLEAPGPLPNTPLYVHFYLLKRYTGLAILQAVDDKENRLVIADFNPLTMLRQSPNQPISLNAQLNNLGTIAHNSMLLNLIRAHDLEGTRIMRLKNVVAKKFFAKLGVASGMSLEEYTMNSFTYANSKGCSYPLDIFQR